MYIPSCLSALHVLLSNIVVALTCAVRAIYFTLERQMCKSRLGCSGSGEANNSYYTLSTPENFGKIIDWQNRCQKLMQ